MNDMHPRLAVGIFVFIYILICALIQGILKINVFDNVLYYIIVVVLSCIVYKYFADRYDGDDNV